MSAQAITAEPHPLVGDWVSKTKGVVGEYSIEAVHPDGQVEGVLCAQWDSGRVWGVRLDGQARITESGKDMELDTGGLWRNVRPAPRGTLSEIVWDASKRDGTMIAQLDYTRSKRPGCAHRFPRAGVTQALASRPSESIVGEWSRTKSNGTVVELAVEDAEGGAPRGRLCTRTKDGRITLTDLHKGGGSRASYDAQTHTLTMTETRTSGERVTHTFRREGSYKVIQTSVGDDDRESRRRPALLTRGRGRQGCLAETSARVHALSGTWRTKAEDGARTALKVEHDHGGSEVQGVLCTGHKGGKVEVTMIGTRSADEKAKTSARGQRIQINTGGGAEHVLKADPSQARILSYEAHRAAHEDQPVRTELRRTKKKTCATELSATAYDVGVLPLRSAREPMVGEWTGVNRATGSVAEVRIERVKKGKRAVGVICERTGPNTFEKWDLNHRQIKARKEGESIVRWHRNARSHQVAGDMLDSLVLGKSAEEEFLTHIGRLDGKVTGATSMRRGRAEDGCLAHIERQMKRVRP